jgi:AAA+ superfamily predicted ATPase
VYVHSSEEQRASLLIRKAAERLYPGKGEVWTWSLTEGMHCEGREAAGNASTPRGALDFIDSQAGPAFFHLKDFHEPLRESAEVRRRLRDLYESCFGKSKFIIITSPVRFILEELEGIIACLQLRPPDVVELVDLLREENSKLGGESDAVDPSDARLYELASALQGLTMYEARFAIGRALAADPDLGPASLQALREQKHLLVNQTGIIQQVAERTEIEHVGGLETLKTWLAQRQKLFQLRDQVSADLVPKGVLVMGISGCGKSLSVKAIASSFNLPLYRFDMVEVFSGRHGKPEDAFVQACRSLEDVSPAVAWFDEIEMGIASAESAGEQGRIFAFFLTWMQEKARGLFVAATANRIDLLPAEMIRKGRFDEVFFVDLPREDEREEIFRIHLVRRGIVPDELNLGRLTKFCRGWTGAEIEQCVISALTGAHLEQRVVTQDDLLRVASGMVPLSRTMKEQVDHIRGWAFARAVRASLQHEPTQ